MKEWGSAGWTALKEALKVVEKVSDALPPLKMAVGGLLVVIAHIDVRITLHRCDNDIA